MARATLVKTLKARKKAQPSCAKCSKVIEPGEMRYTWTFFRGATYNRHQTCGHPRPSELTQGRVAELYAAQEAVEDACEVDVSAEGFEFEPWREGVAEALGSAKDAAEELADEYREAAEYFGGEGENAERADACEEWGTTLETAISTVEGIEVEDADDDDSSRAPDVDDEEWAEMVEAERIRVLDDACSEVVSAAEEAIQELSI